MKLIAACVHLVSPGRKRQRLIPQLSVASAAAPRYEILPTQHVIAPPKEIPHGRRNGKAAAKPQAARPHQCLGSLRSHHRMASQRTTAPGWPSTLWQGLTLWGMVVPEAIAYAGIAGLPPQAGLYTLLASLLIYALLGTSRHLVVQATSATAALLASSIAAALIATSAEAASDPETYQAYASAFVMVVGIVFLAAGLARIGFVTQFLSKPVMDGFVMGLAVFVAVGQLNKLFGVPKPEGNVVDKLLGIIRELPEANWVTFAVGASALALLFLLPRWNKKIPAGLVVLFGSIGVSTLLNLSGRFGVEVVGVLPQGLPSLALPRVSITPHGWQWCFRRLASFSWPTARRWALRASLPRNTATKLTPTRS